MHRREYLGLFGAGSLTFIAGCSSSDSDGSSEDPGQETSEASIEIARSEYILANSVTSQQDTEIPWGVVDVENTSQAPHGPAQLQIRFYDSDENLLESMDGANISYIPAETTWRYYQRYYTETPDQLETVEARIVQNSPVVNAPQIEGEILNSNLDVDPEAGVDLAAEVDIGDTSVDRISAIGLLYDDSGSLRGSISRVIRNPGDTVAISGGTLARTPPSLEDEQITNFELLLFDGLVS